MTDAATTTADAMPVPATGTRTFNYDRSDMALAAGFVLALGVSSVELTTLTGLPAHPLLLHIPVIFVPLLAIAAIAFAVKPVWRKRYGIAYAIGALATMAGTGLAVGAGEAFKESRDQLAGGFRAAGAAFTAAGPDAAQARALEQHAELGAAARIVVFALVTVILAQIAIDRGVVPALSKLFTRAKAPLVVALAALTIGLAAASGGLIIAAGHAGAKVTFGKQVTPSAQTAVQSNS